MSDATATMTPPSREAGVPKLSVDALTVERTLANGERIVAAQDVSFDIATGEFVCLLGPSGCGKTSILNVLAGLDRPSAGRALLDGAPIEGPGPDRAVLFQDPALFPWLSVRGNVELALELIGVDGDERRERSRAALASVGLSDALDVQPHELSAGMRQRAALARALACDPSVVLGDEPFGVLDAQTRELLQNEVQRVWMGSGGRTTFLFISHNVREAVLLADRVLVMSARPGRLLEEFRIHAPRPRDLDDVLVGRVVSEIHALMLREQEGPGA